ncbi:replicative DNA helicase [Caulobacter sp. NIBR2454]|uniref:replicative DNA helicase n=1 Tax=Caulobacter sp. NIBR2454 TaxID=3015996 RepID=UPI0022B6ECD8|nr:DnaB-like helicase C-terminal domain-containing protein [Caulobacter sp. NIBR2454]
MSAISRNAVSPDFDAGLYAVESEDAALGAMMAYYSVCQDAAGRLKDGFFSHPMKDRLCALIKARGDRGDPTAPMFIRDDMGADPDFVAWGGYDSLFQLYSDAYAVGIDHHVEAICDRAQRRALHGLCSDVTHLALDTAAGTAAAALSTLEAGAAKIAQGSSTKEAWRTGGDVVRAAIQTATSRDGRMEFTTGLSEVDDLIGGFNRGELTIIGGRPGMAKSLVASQILKANASRGKGTCFMSLEMGEEPLGLRLACDVAFRPLYYNDQPSTPSYDMARKNMLRPEQWAQLDEAATIIDEWPMLLDTRPGLTLAQIEACVRRQHRKWEQRGIDPGPLLIDHMGKIKPEKERQGSKHAEVADVSNGLAAMAKRLDVPVITLCQLNRGVEGRDDKRPQLSDLRQAGEIEEDARMVIFLYRPEYYYRPPMDKDAEGPAEKAERETKYERNRRKLFWLVEKNSNGPIGMKETFCEVACAAVRDAGSLR